MQTHFERVREVLDRLDRMMASPNRRAILLLAALGGAITLFNWLASDGVRGWLYSRLREMGGQPMLLGGWLVVGAIVAAIVLAFLDTSETAKWLGRRLKAPTQADVDEARSAHRAAERETRELRWQVLYDTQPEQLPVATDADIAQVRTEIARLETALSPLAQALGGSTHFSDGIINEIAIGFRQSLADDLAPYFAQYFYHHVGAPTVRLLSLLRHPKTEDPRQVFRAFYARYREFRDWPGRAAAIQGRELETFQTFDAWRLADAEFFALLKGLPNEAECAGLRRFIEQHRQDGGYPEPLTDPQ